MTFLRWLITILIASTALLVSPDASALGCWQCEYAHNTCYYYRDAEFSSCRSGCDRMYTRNTAPWDACQQACVWEFNAGRLQCDDEREWCFANCEGPENDGRPRENCPIVLDTGRPGWRFTSAAAGVLFDIDGDGQREAISWTDRDAGDGFLVWDRNLNGIIDSGRELFGDSTPQPPSNAPNGFIALAVLDDTAYGGDADGAITSRDAIWPALRVWVDRNQNGRSEDGELESLDSHDIVAIDLTFHESRRRDPNGNELRYRSQVLTRQGSTSHAVDVFFQRLP